MTERWEEFTALDHPSLLKLLFYPRPDGQVVSGSDNMQNFDLDVGGGISISCTFYFSDKNAANMLFFHGNGELASEYVDVGYVFNEAGINLFVADYRGYGRSGGQPTFSGIIKDAHPVYRGFKQALSDGGFSGQRFIMGRSMGSAPAIELAADYQAELKGVVIESGFCDVTDLLSRLGISLSSQVSSMPFSPNYARVKGIVIPALVIHGEYDSLVPLEEGEKIYQNIGSSDKRLVVISGADHNNIFTAGMEEYMKELKDFVARNSA